MPFFLSSHRLLENGQKKKVSNESIKSAPSPLTDGHTFMSSSFGNPTIMRNPELVDIN